MSTSIAHVPFYDRPIRITGLQACQWGGRRAEFVKGLLREVMEEREGRPLAWVMDINIDAITLVYADSGKPVMVPPSSSGDGATLLLAAP